MPLRRDRELSRNCQYSKFNWAKIVPNQRNRKVSIMAKRSLFCFLLCPIRTIGIKTKIMGVRLFIKIGKINFNVVKVVYMVN